MKWYYVENGQQAGPVEEAQLGELISTGKLRGDTLVWHEGMGAWQPFTAVCPPQFAAAIGAKPIGMGAATGDAPEAVCAECNNIFRKEDMIPHAGVFICANCKPVFMQKIAEGARINTGEMRYAGFWIRFVAKFVDGLILGIPLVIVMVVVIMGAAAGSGGNNPEAWVNVVTMLAQLGFYAVSILYNAFFVGKFGATPGKMICKIRVVTGTGETVSYGRATGRAFAELLSGLICNIGYLIAAFDSEKRSLHDHICNTRVVMK